MAENVVCVALCVRACCRGLLRLVLAIVAVGEGNMITCKHQQMAYFGIFEPNYGRKTVMLACHKIGEHNKVEFLKAPSMGDKPYYVSGAVAKKYPKKSNTSIVCYDVPLHELEPLEYQQGCIHLV